jgi:hypothetical protein
MKSLKKIKETFKRAYIRYPESSEALSWVSLNINLYDENKSISCKKNKVEDKIL